jgi:amino acid transporter
MKTQILNDLLGSLTIVNYIVAFFFVFLALLAKWTYKTIDGIKNSPHTPEKMDWTYWLKDNLYPKLVSLLSSVISVFIILRFSNDLVGQQFSYFFALVVGFGLDYFVDKIKKMQPKLMATVQNDVVQPDPNDPKPR